MEELYRLLGPGAVRGVIGELFAGKTVKQIFAFRYVTGGHDRDLNRQQGLRNSYS